MHCLDLCSCENQGCFFLQRQKDNKFERLIGDFLLLYGSALKKKVKIY